MITAILLAAGQSKRLVNQNKLIKKYKKKPLINHVVQSIIKSKIEKLIIVLGFEYLKVKKKVNKNKKIHFVINHNYKKGISSSIKCGLKKISNKNDGFIIVQADMPKISKNIFNKLHTEIKTNKKEIFVPIKNNKIGNPIGFKLSMIKSSEWSHPYYWAGFTSIGGK